MGSLASDSLELSRLLFGSRGKLRVLHVMLRNPDLTAVGRGESLLFSGEGSVMSDHMGVP